MANGAAAGVGIGGKKDVSLFDGFIEVVDKAGYRRAELPGHEATKSIGDNRESIALFANDRRHSRAEQERVHLRSSVDQTVLNQVEGDPIDLHSRKRRRV